MALIAAVAIYQGFSSPGRRRALIELIKHAVPLVPILVFFAAQKATTGNFLANPYFEEHAFAQFSLTSVVLKGGFVLYWILFAQGRFLLAGLICAAFVWRRELLVRRELLLFALIVIFFTLPFSFIYFVPRYCLPALPFAAITGAAALFSLFRGALLAGAAACIVVLLSPVLPDRTPQFTNFENDLQYLDAVAVFKESGDYLAQHHAHTPIYASWPLHSVFLKPVQGYVALPLKVVENPADAEIFVATTLSVPTEQIQAQDLIVRHNYTPRKIFEKNGKTVTLYYRD